MNAKKYEQLPPPSGVIIYFYGELDPLHVQSGELPLSVEELCEKSAKHLSKQLPHRKDSEFENGCCLSSLTLPMFGLIDMDHQMWLSPREKLEPDVQHTLYFRIRFCIYPTKLNQLCGLDPQTWEYLYQQLLSDFLDDRLLSMYQKELELKKVLGFVIVAYFIPQPKDKHADQERLVSPTVKFFGLRKHLPKKQRLNFRWPWPYLRLYRSVKEQVTEYKEKTFRSNPGVSKFKQTYMNGLLEEVGKYGSEVFEATEVNMDEKREMDIVVDPFAAKPPGIYFGTESVCLFPEVQNLTLHILNDRDFQGEVILIRKNGAPKKFLFKTSKMAQSFVACVDGYCRLLCDFHYSLCNSYNVEPPSVTVLRNIKAFGPMLADDAEKELEKEFSGDEDFSRRITACLLIHQSVDSLCDFFILMKKHSEDEIHRDKLHYDRVKDSFTGSLRDIGEIDCNASVLFEMLKKSWRIVKPKNECTLTELFQCEDSSYYYTTTNTKTVRTDEPTLFKEDALDNNNMHLIGQGKFTEVYLASIQSRRDDDEEQQVAVKQMTFGKTEFHEHFQNGISKLMNLQSDSKKTFVRLYGYMIKAPFRVLLEYVNLKDLHQLMKKAPKPLSMPQVMSVVEQLTHGLTLMKERNETHGNLRCQNILLARWRSTDLLVKIADPGMESLYNSLPLDDEVNIERLAWVAVERFDKLSAVTLESEIYAFGTTCWELLSEGKLPKDVLKDVRTPQQQIAHFKSGLRLPRPVGLVVSDEMGPKDPKDSNDLKEQEDLDQEKEAKDLMWKMIQQCWDANPEHRPSIKEITRTVLELCDMVRIETEDPEASKTWATLLNELDTQSLTPRGERTIITKERLNVDETDSGILGTGHFGQVRKGKLFEPQAKLNQTSRKPPIDVAVKSLKGVAAKVKVEFINEIDIASGLDHKNIVKVIGVCCLPHDQLVMEFVELGSISKYLKDLKPPVNQAMLARFCLEVAEGMEYLHSRKILHRDLAARNVLLTRDRVAKITDFGLAKNLADKDYYRGTKQKDIPALWCAPEALTHQHFSMKGDVWSYGILLWEIFNLGRKKPQLVPEFNIFVYELQKGHRLPEPSHAPPGFYKLMKEDCWQLHPDKRPSFTVIVKKVQGTAANLPLEGSGTFYHRE